MPNAYNQDSSVTISSNTLFHFTCNINHIISILEEEFRPNLSLEDLSCLNIGQKVAIPMVSFCDIPLSQAKKHMKVYGYYGIGLSKSWGQEKGVNPVLYTYQGSPLSASLSQSLVWTYERYLGIKKLDQRYPNEVWAKIASIFRDAKKDTTSHKKYLKLWDKLLRIQCFIKPYEGPFHRCGKLYRRHRFYNEREWRFVPELGGDLIKYLLYEDEYNDIPAREKANHEIHERSRIPFEPTDIKYIIIGRNKQILPMRKKIEDIKAHRYSDEDKLKVLSSKVISAEQIAEDF